MLLGHISRNIGGLNGFCLIFQIHEGEAAL